MSKAGKRVKSGTNVQGAGGAAKWEVALQTTPFEESTWKPSVTLIVPNRVEDLNYAKILHNAIQSGLRKLFTLITPEVLLAEVKELGNPKVKKGKDVPPNFEICEVCKPILDAGEDLPPPLLARLIKYKLLTLKTNDIRRREAEKKAAQEKEKAKLAVDKGGKERSKSPKKGGKKTPEPQAAKEGSKLKKRGEEDSVNRFLDDEPDDGAQHYFILSGFRTPYLLTQLDEIGVCVDSVIRFRSQDYTRFLPLAHAESESKDEKTLAAEEAVRKENERTSQELAVFWRDMPLILKRQPEGSKLQDTARLEYEVKTLIVPANFEDNDPKISFGATMFDDISSMIYDLLDAKRLYQTYLENLKLIHVPSTMDAPSTNLGPDGQSQSSAPTPSGLPTTGGEGGSPEASSAVDTRYYNDLMNTIPSESVSVPLILHCMLEQVVATEEGREPPSEEVPPPRSDGMNYDLFAHLSGLAAKLALTPEEHETLAAAFELPRPIPPASKQPQILSYHDEIAKRTHHLKTIYGFNAQETEHKMLDFIPFHALAELPPPSTTVMRERAGRLQEVIHHCSVNNLHFTEIDWAFKQFVFECMDLITTDPNGFLLTREGEGAHHHVVPWDDPYPVYRCMIPRHHSFSVQLPRSLTAVRSGAVTPSLSDRDSDLLLPRSSSHTPTSPSSVSGSKKGILRASSITEIPEGRARRNSVFFDVVQVEKEQEVHIPPLNDDDEDELSATAIDAGKTLEESQMEMVDSQQRNLDQWCFAEHFEPHVMLQVLRSASYVLPYVDLYPHKRDNSMMLVLHCPHNPEMQLHLDWHCELHSNLGFRNYLENVAESIADWLKEKEAEYQAKLLSDEVRKMREDEEAVAKAAAKGTQKDRGKSPKKSPSRSKSPKGRGSRGSSANVSPSPSNPYIRAGSLKALREEQERLKAEEEEKDRQKKDARKSPRKDKNTDKDDKEKDKEDTQRSRKDLSGSRASNKSRQSRDTDVAEQEVAAPPVDEKYWPFSGYDMGNQMIHVSGITTTLFPSDGGQIRTERIDYVQGSTCIKTSVLKDGHVFTVHVLDPVEKKEEDEESSKVLTEKNKTEEEASWKEDTGEEATPKEVEAQAPGEGSQPQTPTKPATPPKKKSVSFFGSVTAHLVDGMTFALSSHGATGEAPDLRRAEPEPMPVPPPAASPLPPPTKESPSKGKGKDKGKERAPPTPEPQSAQDDPSLETEEEPIPVQPFQQVNVTSPDGLSVAFFLESSVGIRPTSVDDRRLVVRQAYAYKTSGQQVCESLRKKYSLTEASRIITSEGTVIKNMVDGSVEVLYADSTVSIHTGPWASLSRSASPIRESSARSARQEEGGETTEKSKKGVGKSASRHGQKSQVATAHAPEPVAALEEATSQRGTWVTTYPSGDKIIATGDQVEEGPPVMISIASDPETRQSMATRDDHVVTVSYPDGTTIVEHSDGTRITTYYRQTQTPVPQSDADETGETPQYELRTIKFVKVECPAYATVEFNCSTSENLTIFGNGTTFNVFPDGYYMIHQLDGSKIEVDTEGCVVYFPRQSQHMEQLLPAQEGQYILRHNADVVVETVDPEGNVFNVRANGDFKVIPAFGEDSRSFDSIEGPNQSSTKKMESYQQHSPRFFVIYPDGSGMELLRWQDVADYMTVAEQSSATAILREPLNDFPGVTGITVLKPYVTGISDLWLKKYDMDSIVPRGIRSRDLTTLPPHEAKKAGPQFGTTVGKGLAIGTTASIMSVRIPILKCPEILEVRQVLQRKPISDNLRAMLQKGLKAFADEATRRHRLSLDLQIQDPRSESERILAADLASTVIIPPKSKVAMPDGDIKEIYEKATAPPAPSPAPTPQPKRTGADWERDQRELAEEATNRKALRCNIIPPYFESELGKAFLLTQARDMDEMMRELSDDPRRDGTEAVRADTASAEFRESKTPGDRTLFQSTLPTSERSDLGESPLLHPTGLKMVVDTPVSFSGVFSEMGTTPSALRPGNPTPAHATGQGSPAPVRPKNPTPAHASKVVHDRPINPTPKLAGGLTDSPSEFSEHPYQRSEYPMIPEQPMEEERTEITPQDDADLLLTRSLRVDVVGEPRRDPVLLPSSIKGGRPGAMPNQRFQMVEEPVRRKLNNVMTVGSGEQARGLLGQLRGLSLLPEEVDFGVLREGNTYLFTVYLKNTGMDTCRFKVSQPPPATGIRVLYKPGPIPAGLRTELNLEIYAIAVGVTGESGVGSIVHDLQVTTETDVLTLPIRATVLTGYEYDHRSLQTPRGGKSAGTRLVSTKPPSSTGIIRPRREQLTGMSM